MSQRLPRAAGTIATSEAASELVKNIRAPDPDVCAEPPSARFDRAASRAFRERVRGSARSPSRDCGSSFDRSLGRNRRSSPRADLSTTSARFSCARWLGDARLAHPENVLQLRDRQLFLLEQKEEPEAGGIGQQAEEFYELTPSRFKIRYIDAS